MSDHDALLAAVLADPDDDLPRLVFADWLEETGHPANAARAQYIRAQVELTRHPPGSDAWLALNRTAADLRDRFKDEWDQEFVDKDDWYGFRVVRRRGFVDEVMDITLDRLASIGPRMFASAPVRVLRVVAASEEAWARFGMLKGLGGVRTIQFGPGMWNLVQRYDAPDEGPLHAILSHRHLSGVRRLELSGNALDDGFTVRFARLFPGSAFAESLTELDLSRNEITDAGANTLAATTGLDRFDRLILSGNRVRADGAAVLRARFGNRVSV